MQGLKKHIEANTEARKLERIEPLDFLLQNPSKWDSEFLKSVIREYEFLLKLQKKVPEWSSVNVLGYDKKAIEQCSSSLTAAYKFKDIRAKKSLDLTGGYGIDSYYLSQNSSEHHYCEINKELHDIVEHNFEVLNVNNVQFHNSTAESLLYNVRSSFDIIFLDPDRRNANNQRKFQLEDLSPNLLEIKSMLYTLSPLIVIKLSPIIDIKLLLHSITHITKVLIIAVKGEVKEVLAFIEPSLNKKTRIETANYVNSTWVTDNFPFTNEHLNLNYSSVKQYLYEPHAALMKSQAWSYIQQQYKLDKLAPQSHYFTSNLLLREFPGRVLIVKDTQEYKKKNFKNWTNGSFSVQSRNFGKPAEQLKKQFKIKESNKDFLIFTSDLHRNKIVIKANKLNTL